MENHVLVGCIQTLNKVIRTRFFYVSKETNEVKDVTLELCNAIENFNDHARKIRDTGEYAMFIPYDFKDGLAEYSFGCGLSHYLQRNEFENIITRSQKELSFPLEKCRISMYTPDDVKHILSCQGVFDMNITQSLKERFGIKEIA
ncbi:hypothetical protein CVD28_02545 [Bacillus sp. M6-12]|uniref:hypothetical protein n=1 Tax=Bacillus sp. M6-12 TaxID=2054166 RepID=UPI000C78C491|nr:hypothetical protein [Bacillus sp. M6-12]PLS19311.1 hypothetical protein CVD28_02545 [Bacillus sp. M6-12]